MIKDLYGLMLRYNFKPERKFDQNFIINEEIIKKVIETLDIQKNEIILEVGCGTGFLTKEIIKLSKKVIVIEKDKKMCEITQKEIDSKNLEIINDDFLKINLNNIKYDKLVSFVPYSISKAFIEKINKHKKTCVLIVQKEFAEKLIAQPGFKNYTEITVLTQSYFSVKYIKNISKKCFFPAPNCESSIIILTSLNKNVDLNYNLFIKEIFRYVNKNLENALNLVSKNIKINKEKIKKINKQKLCQKVKLLNINDIFDVYEKIFK